MIGQTISHYRITGQLGSGGMGVVYKAEDTNLDRIVALKFLASHLLESDEHKQRFLREAKAAASLDHPNICMVHEVGEADGRVFLAMGYIDGPEVRAKIKERPLKLDDALDIAIQAAEGLRAAHAKGVVHRDIKSSNLMLTSTGQVKIMDFGLAQLTGGTRLTRTDTVLGTPAYMSPEQAQRLATDQRTDIWSLGVVLYEMVTGRLPFEGDREPAVVHSIIHEPHEPITAIRAGVPLELDRIVGKALAKNPAQRYQHVDDMLVDLRALRGNLSAARTTVSPSAGPPSKPRRWIRAAMIALLLAAGYFAWRAARAPDPAEPLRATTLTTSPGEKLYPSLSPDGNHVAFTWAGQKQDNPDIYVQQIGTGSPMRLTTDPRSDSNPVWSPDGRSIAFLRGDPASPLSSRSHELRVSAPLGGGERKVTEFRTQEVTMYGTYLAWCPGSECVVVTNSLGEGKPDALFVVSLESGDKRQLTNPQPHVLADNSPAVSPDGRWLAFRRFTAWARGDLHLLPLGNGMTAAGEPIRLDTQAPAANNTSWLSLFGAAHPAWMPDSKELLFSARGSLWRLAVNVNGEGPPMRIPFVGEDGLMPVVSRPQPDRPARLVYFRSFDDHNIWRIDTPAPGAPASSGPVVAIASSRAEMHSRFSPDGRRVAFTSDRTGAWEIWLADPDGSNLFQLTSMGAQATGTGSPHWSPDGSQIVFASDAEGQFEIYVVSAAGGKPRRLTSDPAFDHGPRFSRDGKWIYFNSQRTGDYRVWRMPAAGGDAVQITQDAGHVQGESADGAYLYYVGTSVAGSPLWRMPVSGGQPEKVLDGVVWWSAEVHARGIYFIDRPATEARVQFFDFATRRSTTVARGLGEWAANLTASPDGRTILFSRVDSSIKDLMLVENFR